MDKYGGFLQNGVVQITWRSMYNVPRANRRADRVFRREIDDVLMYYSDNELHQRYRFSRHTIRYITGLVFIIIYFII